jgi:chaperonin GroEL (HSP60 family)
MAPVERLYKNAGYSTEEWKLIVSKYGNETFDLLEGKMVDPYTAGLLDSTPAVLEAISNAISIATLLGTCGGTIVFRRDTELERKESVDTRNFLNQVNEEPITERP